MYKTFLLSFVFACLLLYPGSLYSQDISHNDSILSENTPLIIKVSGSISNLSGDQTLCVNEDGNYSVVIQAGADDINYIIWDFGDNSQINEPITTIGTFNQDHSYKKRGIYTLKVTPHNTNGEPLTNLALTLDIKINSCAIPVNHNISNTGY